MGIFEKILPKKRAEVPDTAQPTAEQPSEAKAEPQADSAKPTDAAEAAPAEKSSEIETDVPAKSAEPPKAEEPKTDAAPVAETVADALKQMANPFKSAIAKVKGAVTEVKESAAEPVKEAVAEVKEAAAEPVEEAAAEVIESVAEPVKEAAAEAKESAAEPVKEAAAEVKESVAEPVKEAAAEVKEAVAEPVKEAVAEMKESVAEPVKEAVAEVKESVAEPVKEAVAEVKESVAEPVKEAVAEVKEAVAEPVKEAVATETKNEIPASIVIGPKESILSMCKRMWNAFDEKTSVVAKRMEANAVGRMLFDFADLLETIVISMFVVMLFFTFICCTATVDGTSMLPTLTSGERLMVNRLDHTYETGDILILNSRKSYTFGENDTLEAGDGLGKNIVKRLIAQGGQTVDIDFTAGIVSVDGQPLDEPYTSTLTTRDEGAFTYPLTIPDGYVFVLGDNRSISKDSRHPQVGLIPAEDIVGSVWMRFSPFKVFSSSDDE